MAARLGNVIYWIGLAVAAVLLLLSVAFLVLGRDGTCGPQAMRPCGLTMDQIFPAALFAIAALATAALGRAIKYVLAGR